MKSDCIFAFESNYSPKRIIMKKAFTLATLAIIIHHSKFIIPKNNVFSLRDNYQTLKITKQ